MATQGNSPGWWAPLVVLAVGTLAIGSLIAHEYKIDRIDETCDGRNYRILVENMGVLYCNQIAKDGAADCRRKHGDVVDQISFGSSTVLLRNCK